MRRRGSVTTCLILPGLNGSGPGHWQTRWERCRSDCRRVQFGCWALPERRRWLSRLDAAVLAAPAPIILVAHSLGCHAVAWWAAEADPGATGRVAAAMLVAPPDLDAPCLMEELRAFAPAPVGALPFPSLLVASRDDPYSTFESSVRLADAWAASLVDAGRQGHLNAHSHLGDWPYGQQLLDRLIAGSDAQA